MCGAAALTFVGMLPDEIAHVDRASTLDPAAAFAAVGCGACGARAMARARRGERRISIGVLG
jgi:hypothetical protein